MAYTASDALADVKAYLLEEETKKIALYQTTVFDKITAAAKLGKTSVELALVEARYKSIKPTLVNNGYTVGTWADGKFTVQWTASTTISIAPTTLNLVKGELYTANFYLDNATVVAWELSTGNGCLPTGLSLSIAGSTCSISGTPTTISDDFFDLIATDTNGTVTKNRVQWRVDTRNVSDFFNEKTLDTVPASAYGSLGDYAGNIAQDDRYFYVCVKNYNSLAPTTVIWWRIDLYDSNSFDTNGSW